MRINVIFSDDSPFGVSATIRYNALMSLLPRLYFDNAATSFPKPPAVLAAINHYAAELGASPGRGSYQESVEAGELLTQCRRRIAALIHADPDAPEHVVFTLNCSDALNMAIKGVVRHAAGKLPAGRKPHVITTELDHNSILRPFNQLAADGEVEQTRLACDPVTGLANVDDLRRAIRPHTCLIAMLHGSNVTGTVQPIAEFGRVAKEHGILFLVDAAQTLGHMPLDIDAMHIDLLAAPGHKGLLGPLGTGLLYIRPGVEARMTTLREGGTGSVSELDTQPDFMPDRFEPGSHNTLGLVGLSEGVAYIIQRGIADLADHQRQLIDAFLTALDKADAPALHMYGPPTAAHRCGVFSVRIDGFDAPADLSAALEDEFGILTRSGLHCAPGAHRTIGTNTLGGTTRLSFGPFLTADDVRFAAESLAALARRCATVS